MSVVLPESYDKRSLTYRLHDAVSYTERDGTCLVDVYTGQSGVEQLSECALLDLSGVHRTGLRGKQTEKVLAQEGLPFPEKPNQVSISDKGAMVARLGSTESWVLDNPLQEVSGLGMLELRVLNEPGCYPLYCQHSHAWFALTGRHLPELMAKICGVDLREEAFPLGSIVQTSVARVGAIIIHHQLEGLPAFSIMSDSSSAEYLWHALIDATQEFQGKPVGLGAFL